MFSSEYYEIFIKIYFEQHLPTAFSVTKGFEQKAQEYPFLFFSRNIFWWKKHPITLLKTCMENERFLINILARSKKT